MVNRSLMNGCEWLDRGGASLPADFFEKFAGVEKISARAAVQDDRHFRWFLKSLRSCTSLWLTVRRRFLHKYHLPRLAPSLETLGMSAYDPTGLLFDFDFLYQLPSLSCLSISGALTLETIRSLVDLFEDLDEVHFEFECKDREVYVHKSFFG